MLQGQSRFADVGQLEQREVIDARTRRFVGDGTAFLIVTGLLAVTGVTVGMTPVPLTETRRYAEDATGRETPPVEEPIIELQTTLDGRQVLLRSPLSNHGVWQKDVAVYVSGDWSADAPQPDSEGKAVTSPLILPPGVTGGDAAAADASANADAKSEGGAPAEADESGFVDTGVTFDNLPDNIKAGLAQFKSVDEALAADNAAFNAVGIKGLDIVQAKAALKRAKAAAETAV